VGRLLTAASVLVRVFKRSGLQGRAVGVMLPNTVGVAPVSLALQALGHVPALLNYTAGAASLRSACQTAPLSCVVSSRLFVQKAKLEPLVEALQSQVQFVWIEDVRSQITLFDKVLSVVAPARCAAKRDDTAFLLFTSGSEGVPKGVALSHGNVLSNIEQVLDVVPLFRQDCLFNALPLFHSFGLLAGLWLPLVAGFRSHLFPSPLQYKTLCDEVKRVGATIFVSTDTFLRGTALHATADDFSSVRLVVAGAEAVKPATRALVRERMGQEIYEGYGVTECSPVTSVNTPDAQRVGTVGRLFPRMEARFEPVEGLTTEGGRLFLRGPNIMQGYVLANNPGVVVPPEGGWHDTGDIVHMDAEGYLTIKGRAKRFAKIGGEMVSLAAVEALCADLVGEALLVAVALPDAKRGERVVVMTTEPTLSLEALRLHFKAQGASELMLPERVVPVDDLPVLGTGKIHFMEARQQALAMGL
jgi:acyl-[acyl-carrier-protein]-phospholipid O-acyltransferase/long-chain-fatty-acid--[acyl-carrier-protein] ligase